MFTLLTLASLPITATAIIPQFDFGDAPDSYKTLLASDGARHLRNPDVFMGLRIDVEPDGQPTSDANGDDFNPSAGDDEDGVIFMTPVAVGEVVTVEVRVSTSGRLNAWLDFAGDGSWAEPGDQIFRDQVVVSGINSLTFDVPPDAKLGRTAARFRYNLQGGLTYTGLATDGEVEDYLVTLVPKPVACERTNKGRDFWLTFPGNYAPDPDNPLRLRLGIVGPRTTTGTVEIPGLGWSSNWVIGAAQRVIIDLPKQAELGDANDEILKNGIHVTASAEVAVFGLNRVLYTTDGYLGLPSDVLGKEYIIQAYGNVHDAAPPLNGTQFGLVACEDATQVTIVPSVAAAGHAKGVAYSIVLNRGETYQLRGTNGAPTDLSGTFVVGDKPIAVFGSHQCANLPDDTVWFCDYIVEQILPEERAATSFVAMPLATRTGGDTYRFYAVEDKTPVFLNGAHIVTLDRGEFHQRKVVGPAYITAENRIHVVQYANSSDFDLVTSSDPFQVVIPPLEMFRTEYEIWVPETGPYPANYLNVVVPSGGVGLVRVDGIPIPAGSYVPIPGSGHHGAQVPITVGAHFLDSGGASGGKFPFGVIVYGWDVYDSYGYPGGMFFKDKTPPTLLCPVTSTNVFVSPNFNCQGQVPDVAQGVMVTDNCPLSPDQNIFQQPFPGTLVPVGTHVIRVYSTDAEGNLGFCEVTLNVLDASRPVLQCPGEIIATCRTNNGAIVGFNVAATTSCGTAVPVTCTPPSGAFFPAGTTSVTCVAINATGLTETCAFPVTVRCLNITLKNPPGSITASWTGGGTLQTATQLTATAWIDLPQAASPYTVPPTNGMRFFRMKY